MQLKTQLQSREEAAASLQSSTFNERASLNEGFGAIRADPELNKFLGTRQSSFLGGPESLNDRDENAGPLLSKDLAGRAFVTSEAWRATTAAAD